MIENNRLNPVLPVEPQPVLRHSWLGIASFVLALAAILVMCGDVALVMGLSGGLDISPRYNALDTLLSCGAAILAAIGLGLGIAAVVQKNTKKLFGILGLVLSALYLLGYCALVGINILSLGVI